MTKPTIDELIAQTNDYYCDPERCLNQTPRTYFAAILDILEQHKETAYVMCAICGVIPSKLKDGQSIVFLCNEHDPRNEKYAPVIISKEQWSFLHKQVAKAED